MYLVSARLKWLRSPEEMARFLGLFLICSVLSGSQQPNLLAKQNLEVKKASPLESYTDTDGYQIYASLLEGKKSSFIIQAETDSWEKARPDNLDIKGNLQFMKRWGTVLMDFAAKDQTSRLLGKNIPLAASYEIVPRDAITSIFKHEQGWTTFWERYPLAYGYYTFSAVGFNPHRTRALVWVTYLCGGLCGYARYHFFEKSGGRWHEVSVKAEVSGLNF